MLGSILAIMVAFTFSLSVILVRRGIERSNFFSASLVISIVGGAIIIPPAFLLTPLDSTNINGLLFFILAGLIHPGLSRLIYFRGMEKIGASINASIFASYPIFSTLFAAFILNESITFKLFIGVLLVVVGAIVIQASIHNSRVNLSKRRGLIYPLTNAVLVGLSYVIKKMGLNAWNTPLMATAIAYLATICFYIFLMFTPLSSSSNRKEVLGKFSFKLFWKPGVGFTVGHLLIFYALRYGDVSTVTPLVQLEPLFILMFIKYYLKSIEKVTSKLIFGTLFIIVGAIFVST